MIGVYINSVQEQNFPSNKFLHALLCLFIFSMMHILKILSIKTVIIQNIVGIGRLRLNKQEHFEQGQNAWWIACND